MCLPASIPRKNKRSLNLIVLIGLISGFLITALIWLKVPDEIIAPLSWLCLGLIGSGSFLFFHQTPASHPRWVMILAAIAAVSLVYLFPELFGPSCGGMPRAFALNCAPECRIRECTKWVEGPSPQCPKPGPGGGCCLSYITTCDSDCEPPPPPDQPPTITGTFTCTQWGENSWCINNATLELIANEPQGKQLQISGDVGGTPFACAAGNGSTNCSVPLPEGRATVNYLATSITGLTGSGSKAYQYDPTLPKIEGALNGTTGTNDWFISSVDVNASASDPGPGSGMSAFEYNLNSGSWSNFPGTLSFTDGVYSLSLRASDVAGNAVEANQTIQVDTITPTLNLSAIGTVGTNGWYSSNVQVSATASDSGSGLGVFEYNLDDAGWTPYSGPLELTDGVYNLSLRVSDNAGNLTEGTQTFLVDTLAPSIDLSLVGTEGENGWYTSAVQVSASADDAGSGFAGLEVTLDNGPWNAYSAPLEFGDGLHTYQFRAIDNAGNLAATAEQQVRVDTIPPVIDLPDSWELGQTVIFDLQDDGSGLATVRLVVEDEDERYPKVAWNEGLGSYKFKGDINWDGRFKDGQLAPPGGEYYAWLKVSDKAGNERKQAGQIIVPFESFLEELILPPGHQVGDLVSGTKASGTVPEVPALPSTNSSAALAPQPPAINVLPPISFGGSNNSTAKPSKAQSGKVSFHAGGPSTSPATNPQSNLLWGATATAAIGAFAAEIARKKAEEEARAAAKARANERRENRASSNFRQKAKASKMAQLEAKWAEARLVAQIRIQTTRNRILGKKDVGVEIEMRSHLTKAQAQQDAAERAKQKSYDAYRAQEVATHTKITPPKEAEKSWLDKAIDWVDNNQVFTSIGIGIAIGLGAAAIVLTGGAAAPVIIGAVVLAGGITGGGTIALNARYKRDWNKNLFRNMVITVGTTIITAGITVVGAKVIGSGMTFCTMNPTCSRLIDPAMKTVDFIEETSLVIKAGVQTFFGDSLGAGETLVELELERMDGGMPGNSLVKELGSESLEDLAKYGDDAVELISRYGDDAIEIISKYGDDSVDLMRQYQDDAINLIKDYGDDGIKLLKKYGDNAVSLYKKYGDNGVKILERYGDDILNVSKNGVITVAGENAEKIIRELSESSNNEVFYSAVSGALNLPNSTKEGIQVTKKLTDIGLDGTESDKLIQVIVENSTRGSGNRLVLGKWFKMEDGGGYVKDALDNGGIFLDTGPEISKILGDSDIEFWVLNEKFLKNQLEANVEKIDFVTGNVDDLLEMYHGVPDVDVPYNVREIRWLEANADGYTRVENSWFLNR